eukprot:jgi/Antlo1/602/2579
METVCRKQLQVNYDTMYELNRLSKNVSAVFMHFSAYYYVRKNTVHSAQFLLLSMLSIFIFVFFKQTLSTETVAQALIILSIVFLTTPILRTLVDEISDDTIYMHFVLLSLFFVFDTTRCAVMNDPERKPCIEDRPLEIEHVDIFKVKTTHVPVVGYNAMLLSSILLTSRLDNDIDAFFVHCFTFFWYFIVDHGARSRRRRFDFVLSLLIIILTSIACIYVLVIVFYVFIAVQIVLYLVGFIIIHLVNKLYCICDYRMPRTGGTIHSQYQN